MGLEASVMAVMPALYRQFRWASQGTFAMLHRAAGHVALTYSVGLTLVPVAGVNSEPLQRLCSPKGTQQSMVFRCNGQYFACVTS
ncbi:hypothetical protein AVEN_193339-1 [Araneus ventricosus]|uniref:Uncharacterized protein n=1 Tax=Araneus ventricosus TaxID=182803 RepID=A0A4Y2ERS4_ARAVE|nr:hypothetical protein AVEN_193339-1 [Araneus ventricosus]